MIKEFQGDFRFLSNFWPAQVELDGQLYPTVEHAYQAAKTLSPTARKHIQHARTPGHAKRAGKLADKRADWDEVKLDVMRRLLVQKFTIYPLLREQLLATGNEELQEGNDWNDRFWGICRGVGENHLGKMLMEIRAGLRLEVDK